MLGQSIAHKERIETTAAGSVQLLFLDKTSMTIGPNSDVSIDEYVYDPQANSGKLAATLAKGAMRFVGGQISHNGEATIKTATAVVGIRGGVSILTNANVYLGYGWANVDAGGGSVTLQAGEYTSTSLGALPTPPGPPPPEFIANLVRLFQSVGDQTGGTARGAASQSKVAAAEQRVTGSGNPVSGTLPTNVTYTPPNTVINTVNQAIQTTSQTQATSQSAGSANQSANQSTTLTGWVGGLMHSNVNGGPITTYSLLGAAEITLDATKSRVQALFGVIGVAQDGPSTPTFLYQFGSIDPGQPGSSLFTSYDTFSAQAAHASNGSPLSTADGVPLTGHDGQMFNVPRVGRGAGLCRAQQSEPDDLPVRVHALGILDHQRPAHGERTAGRRFGDRRHLGRRPHAQQRRYSDHRHRDLYRPRHREHQQWRQRVSRGRQLHQHGRLCRP